VHVSSTEPPSAEQPRRSDEAPEIEPMVDKRAASRMKGDQPSESEGKASPGTPAEVSTELAEALERAEQHYKSWQRSAADFANYKRRVEQERSESAKFERAALVINLLPVFDDLDRAASTVDTHLAGLNWVQGILAIHRKFASLLQALDVKEIDAVGERFDPALHEAVARQPGEEGKVLHVVQKGYKLGDRVVRPAMVIVGEG
jgi:molecular chaperone GrpE